LYFAILHCNWRNNAVPFRKRSPTRISPRPCDTALIERVNRRADSPFTWRFRGCESREERRVSARSVSRRSSRVVARAAAYERSCFPVRKHDRGDRARAQYREAGGVLKRVFRVRASESSRSRRVTHHPRHWRDVSRNARILSQALWAPRGRCCTREHTFGKFCSLDSLFYKTVLSYNLETLTQS